LILENILYNALSDRNFHVSAQTKGIRRRYFKYTEAWQPHLNKSKECISNWLDKLEDKKELQVLGAGELLDFPNKEVLESFQRIYLTDINLKCSHAWKQLQSKLPKTEIVPVFQDATLILKEWSRLFTNLNSNKIEDYLNYLEAIPRTNPQQSHSFIKTKNIISLNLLSQLPIAWQEFVFSFLEKKFNKTYIKNYSDKILSSLTPCAHQLIESHLKGLVPIKNGSSLIISDMKYFFPEDDSIIPSILETDKTVLIPEINFKNNTKKNSVVLEQDALFGYNLNKKNILKSPSIQVLPIKNWIWNLVPHNSILEKKELHLVTAFQIANK